MIKNREYLNAKGEPEDPNWVKTHEGSFKRIENAEVLDAINFADLRKVFEKLAEKSGVDPKTLNFLDKDRISQVPGFLTGGRFSSSYNYMTFQGSLEAPKNSEAYLIEVLVRLCHEEAHAVSGTQLRALREATEGSLKEGEHAVIHNGYDHDIYEGGQWETFYRLFDEGMTDKLSIVAAREYLLIHPELDPIAKSLEKVKLPYPAAGALIDSLVAKIGQETGLEERVVLDAFVRGKFEGLFLSEGQFKEFFKETVSGDFLKTLATAEDGDMNSMRRKIERSLGRDWGTKLKSKILSLLGSAG